MPKRDRRKAAGGPIGGSEPDEEEAAVETEEDAKLPPKRSRAGKSTSDSKQDFNDEIDDDEEEDIDEDSDEDAEEEEVQPFVAWLEEGSNYMSVGEMHFTNANFTACADGDPSRVTEYYVIKELKLRAEEEDEESPLVFGYDGGSPFGVLPASACVGVDLSPVVPDTVRKPQGENDEEEQEDDDSTPSMICNKYCLEADTHQSLLKYALDDSSDETIKPISPSYKFFSDHGSQKAGGKDSKEAIRTLNAKSSEGLRAWWKAGEAKAGWDLSKIPPNDMIEEDNTVTEYHNPLLELYRDLCAFDPLAPEDDRDAIEERFEWRTCLCTYFAWAVPTHKALATIRALEQPVLEIGAGTGYWAWLLATAFGVDILAYDLPDSHGGQKHRFRHDIVGDGGVEKVSSDEHAGRALMLCWPDIVGDSAPDDADRGTFGLDCLRAYRGTTVVYIGELGPEVVRAAKGWGDPFPPGGSSASAAFQDELRAGYDLSERVRLPNWPPYNSHLWIWKRKPTK